MNVAFLAEKPEGERDMAVAAAPFARDGRTEGTACVLQSEPRPDCRPREMGVGRLHVPIGRGGPA